MCFHTLYDEKKILRKIFKRNKINISYSCIMNMHSILNNHNRRLLDECNRNSGGPDVASCNCRSKEEWLLLKNNEKIFSHYLNSREIIQLFSSFCLCLSLTLSLSLSLSHTHTHTQLNPVILLKYIRFFSIDFLLQKDFQQKLDFIFIIQIHSTFQNFLCFFILLISFSFE